MAWNNRRLRATTLPALTLGLGLAFAAGARADASERVMLRNGFTVDCVRHESEGATLRLYLRDTGADAGAGYMVVASSAVLGIETVADTSMARAEAGPVAKASAVAGVASARGELSATEMRPMLAQAGAAHRIDEDLLASVVRAESGGHAHAVSRTGAQGLMQLMPGTASAMGVKDAFAPQQNIDGGTAYLDRLLTMYHDDIALALAAYNAGPGAVARWHGVPPYRETREYVARVIREFNRRKLAAVTDAGSLRAELR